MINCSSFIKLRMHLAVGSTHPASIPLPVRKFTGKKMHVLRLCSKMGASENFFTASKPL
jgi:hypothetical protein